MSAPIPQPATHECPECHELKPLTRGFFESYKGEGARPTSFKPVCRSCVNAAKRDNPQLTGRCTGCDTTMPLTAEFFPVRSPDRTHPAGGFRSRCLECKRAAGRGVGANPTRKRPLACDPDYVPGPKPCVACASLPWRVDGPRCRACKLPWAREVRPELETRRTR